MYFLIFVFNFGRGSRIHHIGKFSIRSFIITFYSPLISVARKISGSLKVRDWEYKGVGRDKAENEANEARNEVSLELRGNRVGGVASCEYLSRQYCREEHVCSFKI